MTRIDDELPWPPPAHRPSRHGAEALPSRQSAADLAAPATQIVRDREDYLGQGGGDVGRRIADDQVELFVTTDAAQALLAQFDRLAPEFIALHDVGTSTSLRLLASLAGAAGARVQRLSIRRQGHGVALAVLQFVEVPLGGDRHVRVYTTDVNADSLTRRALAEVLMSRSQLGALLVGELPPHALATALKPLSEALGRGQWRNRQLLMLPLGSGGALAALAAQLAGSSGVAVRVTPQAASPNDAWSFISGAWNRLQAAGGPDAALNTDMEHAVPRPQVPHPEAPTQRMELDPATAPVRPPPPARVRPAPAPAPAIPPAPWRTKPAVRWADYAQRCAAIRGVVGCCVFDLSNQLPLAAHGQALPADRMAIQGGLLLDAMADAAQQLGLDKIPPEAAISFGQQHLLLKPVPGHPGIVVHLYLQATPNNLTLARMQLERVVP